VQSSPVDDGQQHFIISVDEGYRKLGITGIKNREKQWLFSYFCEMQKHEIFVRIHVEMCHGLAL
jgi:hypothetical protein